MPRILPIFNHQLSLGHISLVIFQSLQAVCRMACIAVSVTVHYTYNMYELSHGLDINQCTRHLINHHILCNTDASVKWQQ